MCLITLNFYYKQYQLDSLKSLTEQHLINSLTSDNVLEMFVWARTFSAANLKPKCVNFVTKHSTVVMQSEAWKQMKAHGAHITRSDQIER